MKKMKRWPQKGQSYFSKNEKEGLTSLQETWGSQKLGSRMLRRGKGGQWINHNGTWRQVEAATPRKSDLLESIRREKGKTGNGERARGQKKIMPLQIVKNPRGDDGNIPGSRV